MKSYPRTSSQWAAEIGLAFVTGMAVGIVLAIVLIWLTQGA